MCSYPLRIVDTVNGLGAEQIADGVTSGPNVLVHDELNLGVRTDAANATASLDSVDDWALLATVIIGLASWAMDK